MTTDAIEPSDDPQAVKFSVQGHSNIECIAYVLYGQYGINFRLSQSIFNQPPEVEILPIKLCQPCSDNINLSSLFEVFEKQCEAIADDYYSKEKESETETPDLIKAKITITEGIGNEQTVVMYFHKDVKIDLIQRIAFGFKSLTNDVILVTKKDGEKARWDY